MNYKETLLNEAKKMPLLCRKSSNWELRFRFEDGKAIVYRIAKDPTQCNSGYVVVQQIKRCCIRQIISC